MQFYIVHPDPEVNVHLLPEYALKKVNAREGWQILSDIGHRWKVNWPGQNKLYSASHVLTRKHGRSWENLKNFIRHYDACVRWQEIRARGKSGGAGSKVDRFLKALEVHTDHHDQEDPSSSSGPVSPPPIHSSSPPASPYHDRLEAFYASHALQQLCLSMPYHMDEFTDMAQYLLECKASYLTIREKETLRGII